MTLGLCGCGGMGLRHVRGLKALKDAGRPAANLIAVCDPDDGRARQAADLAEELLGRRPGVCGDTDSLLRTGVDAVQVVTPPHLHVEVGVAALESGCHVFVEKPLALTLRQGRKLVAAAAASGRRLAVGENYRWDPVNRFARALIVAGAIGKPVLAIQSSVAAGERVFITPWRHLRRSGGLALDMGIHYADILEFLLGPIDQVAGMSSLVDAERVDAEGRRHPADAEDLTVGIARFRSGALGNWLLHLAGRGEGHFHRTMYGTQGSLVIPSDRSGRKVSLTVRRDGKDVTVSDAEMRSLATDFELNGVTAALFGGDRVWSYGVPFQETDARLLAIEVDDFLSSITEDRAPEVDGEQGLRSMAVVYGFFEGERLGRFVSVDEMVEGMPTPYQDELEEWV